MIKSRFLPQDELPESLQIVCDCVENSNSLRELDLFIHEILIDYKPSQEVLGHIPYARWRSIYTTNFDRLLEQAYEEADGRLQNIHPIYSD